MLVVVIFIGGLIMIENSLLMKYCSNQLREVNEYGVS